MLDNLKLGYGGTQEEMKRLLKDASALKRHKVKNVKYSINKFSDIIEAIHTVQEKHGYHRYNDERGGKHDFGVFEYAQGIVEGYLVKPCFRVTVILTVVSII